MPTTCTPRPALHRCCVVTLPYTHHPAPPCRSKNLFRSNPTAMINWDKDERPGKHRGCGLILLLSARAVVCGCCSPAVQNVREVRCSIPVAPHACTPVASLCSACAFPTSKPQPARQSAAAYRQ